MNWFITGASSGLGRILAEQLLERGDCVAVTVRKPETMDDLKERYAQHLWAYRLDVTDTAAIREVIGKAFADLGRVDVVVSNAGFGVFGAAEELSDAQIMQVINTNLVGSLQVIRAALPHLRAQGGGRILQVSSEGGQIAYPNFSLYHATKWGIEGFVEAVAQEVAPLGIEFTIVEPGPTRTGFGDGLSTASAMDAYENTPSGEMRRALEDGAFVLSDAVKVVRAMIDSANITPAPRRLVTGAGAYGRVHDALAGRLSALEAQRDIAFAVDSAD